MRRKVKQTHERYGIERSPLSQRPTQRDIAELLGETRDDLRRLINYKEMFIVRRQITTGRKNKVRDLAYPVSRLRAVHERLKFHLNKVKQPSYLFSPRKNRGQRDNAVLHLDQDQYLTLDLKQFYPSTSEDMVRRWFRDELAMYDDVAGLLTHLCTIDGKVSFGSPVTPVLCTLVHRAMFDRVAQICSRRGLRFSVWVDDLTISGDFVPGEVLEEIRAVVRDSGLRSHSIRYRSGNRPVFITGIGVVGPKIVTANALNLKIKECWEEYHAAETYEEREFMSQRLLSCLGTVRHIAGAKSVRGRKASDEMNSLRQKRNKKRKMEELARQNQRLMCEDLVESESSESPF
ncbi:reverse transcriptase family protein [Hoeflea alexandrii]|uniref:reverse transcriptase family protein n=1 Tax=Hoeflea alexandrii TaxID=288436 RepID=UPI0035CEF5D6